GRPLARRPPARRIHLLRLLLCLLLGTIERSTFNGSLPHLLVVSRGPCIASIRKWWHRRLRARGASRFRDDRRRHLWSSGHDPRGLVGGRQGNHGGLRGRRRRRAPGPIA